MTGGRLLTGRVRAREADPGARATRVLVTAGDEVLAAVPVDQDGRFELTVPRRAGLVLTVIGLDGRVVRRPLGAGARSTVSMRDLDLAAAEFPAGIAGQAWDAVDDRPVTGGEARLLRPRIGPLTRLLDAAGWFSFELSAENPLTPGIYRVQVEAPGFEPSERSVQVTTEITSYRIGHVELAPKTGKRKR